MRTPKLKKRVTAFLVGEEGKISKKNIIKLGGYLGSLTVAASLVEAGWTHKNELGIHFQHKTHSSVATHNHHANHSSY